MAAASSAQTAEHARVDATLRHDPAVEQDDRHPEVVEAEQLRIGVHVAKRDLHPTSAEQLRGLLAEVTSLAGDQVDLH